MTAVDTLGFAGAVATLPEQFTEALSAARSVDLGGLSEAGIANVAVCGMGGSGISGDVLATAGSHDLTVPVTVLKQYRAPRFVGPGTLFFAVSYSGGTEETLEATVLAPGEAEAVLARAGELGLQPTFSP